MGLLVQNSGHDSYSGPTDLEIEVGGLSHITEGSKYRSLLNTKLYVSSNFL